MPDRVHMLISIPPKYSVAEVIGYLKGKSSIWIAQSVERNLRNFLGHKFWARGYFVGTVRRNEEMISDSPEGAGIHGISDNGYGGHFRGGRAPLRLKRLWRKGPLLRPRPTKRSARCLNATAARFRFTRCARGSLTTFATPLMSASPIKDGGGPVGW
jgi:putative transposase